MGMGIDEFSFADALLAVLNAGRIEQLFVAVFGAQVFKLFFVRVVRFLAVLADGADEPLGKHGEKRIGERELVYAHVQQAGDGFGCVVGVERAEDKVAGEAGFNARGSSLLVTHSFDFCTRSQKTI